MIISHSKKFVFIHGRKTAGSSIGIFLQRHLAPGDIARGYITGGLEVGVLPPDWDKSIFWIRPHDFIGTIPRVKAYRRFVRCRHGISSTHMSAAQIKEYLGPERWNEYFKFTFERNPFERTVSFYYWRIKDLRKKPTFQQFVDALYSGDQAFLTRHNLTGFSNLSFYMIDDKIEVDFVGQYENLKHDFNYVCDRIGVDYDGCLPQNKTGVRPPSSRYSDISNDDLTGKLKAVFAREISLFDYSVPLSKE